LSFAAEPGLRLGNDVVPLRQSVTLDLDPASEAFRGQVTIDVRLAKPLSTIWLNATELEIDQATIRAGERVQSARATKRDDDVIGLVTGDAIPAGVASIEIDYHGAISHKNMRGLFAKQSEGRFYLFSQLEPIDARRAFPCFDEPLYKIPWSVSLRVPESMAALSNAPEVFTSNETGERKLVRFRETAPLPSYLVAVAVGPFDFIDLGEIGRKPTPGRLIVAHGKTSDAQWAANATKRIVPMIEEYFDRAYPFDKLDLIEVPEGGEGLAMENAGLITFTDGFLIARIGEESTHFRRYAANTIAHELSHQWFGDLVTMSWWDDIWLNESFASWMGDKIEDRFENGTETGVPAAKSKHWALEADEAPSATPVRRTIAKRDDIDSFLNSIVYNKGEALLVMFESRLGEEAMRQRVRHYIAQHASGNATANDFLAALSEGGDDDTGAAFASFLDQTGEPIVTAALSCDGSAPQVTLTQKPYSPIGHPRAATNWQIPVCLRDDHHDQCILLREPSMTVPLTGGACPGWLLAGSRGRGYYRQHLSGALLKEALASAVPAMTVVEKMTMLDDARALAQNGELTASDALAIAQRFAGDPDPRVADASILLVRRLAAWAPDRKTFAAFIRSVYGKQAREAGWQPLASDDDDVRELRRDRLTLVTNDGDDADLASQAVPLTRKWLSDSKALDPDLRLTILGIAVQFGGEAMERAVIDAIRKSTDRTQRQIMLSALGFAREPHAVATAIALTLDPNISIEESVTILYRAGADSRSLPASLRFAHDHYDALAERLPNDIFQPSIIYLPYLAEFACDEPSRKWAEQIGVATGKINGGAPIVESVSESISSCEAAKAMQAASMRSFLAH
jgi:alanyl aminopeptidase